MKLEFPESFVLFDTEYTAWGGSRENDWKIPGQHKEVIQIGALRVDPNLTEVAFFNAYIKPVKNPQLSDYIIDLTHITQEKIDTEGESFERALKKFSDFCIDLPLYAWGGDTEVLKENCELVGIPFPLQHNQSTKLHPLLTPVLDERGIDISKYTSGTLIEAFGKKGGRAHDAVNDMRNLLEVLRELR